MKKPLSYAISSIDSASTSFLNALSLLYGGNEIPDEFISGVYSILLSPMSLKMDRSEAMKYLVHWVNGHKDSLLDLKMDYLSSYSVFLGPGCSLYRTLSEGGKAVAKVFGEEGERYIAITEITNDYLYFFDPLFLFPLEESVERVADMPFLSNGRIKMSLLPMVGKNHMRGKDQEKKELVLIERVRQ